MLYSFYFEYISVINDMILNFMILATVKYFLGGVGGVHWAPNSDLRRKIQNNFCDVGVNFLVSDGIK